MHLQVKTQMPPFCVIGNECCFKYSVFAHITKKHKYPKLDSHTSYYVIPNLEAFGGILYGRKSAPPYPRFLVTQVLQYSAQVRTNSENFVPIKQDGMDFVTSERSLTCFCILTHTQICETVDLFKPIHRNDTAPGLKLPRYNFLKITLQCRFLDYIH